MSYGEFQNKVKAYARKAGVDAERIAFETEDGTHTARCAGVTLIGTKANNCMKVIWGSGGQGVSAIYGRARVACVSV